MALWQPFLHSYLCMSDGFAQTGLKDAPLRAAVSLPIPRWHSPLTVELGL